jgi:hypothetical protein
MAFCELGNVTEAITLVPTSATWFVRTELADWPCVVMSGLKFEQANGVDPSGKVISHSALITIQSIHYQLQLIYYMALTCLRYFIRLTEICRGA